MIKRLSINAVIVAGIFLIIPTICSAQDVSPERPCDPYYQTAYTEIVAMLDGRNPVDFKRAVFLVEWAYLRGSLDYDVYCTEIARIVDGILEFIDDRDINQYRTAGNIALFEFFSRPYPMNGDKPYTYDYEDFTGEHDFAKLFVTKLMRTHTGQCRSLPLFYKVLAEELGVESYISMAPQHLFIRHPDETGKPVNVELTSQALSRDAFYISNFGISADAIRNGIYMAPLNMNETLAYLLCEMAEGYERLFDDDVFPLLCANKSLEYYTHNVAAIIIKDKVLRMRGMKYLEEHELDQTVITIYTEWQANRERLENLGYIQMSGEIYQKLLNSAEEQARLYTGQQPASKDS